MTHPIDALRMTLESSGTRLGAQTSTIQVSRDQRGAWQDFSDGSTLVQHPERGVQRLYGLIRDKWVALGRERGPSGYPRMGVARAGSQKGSYANFDNGTIIHKDGTSEAFAVYGLIYREWGRSGWDSGPLGFPSSDEYEDGGRRRSDFEGGYITWDSRRGIQVVRTPPQVVEDPIRAKARALTRAGVILGAAHGDVKRCADGKGRVQDYANGCVVQDPGGRTFWLGAALRAKWASMDRERGPNGYPVCDESVSQGAPGVYANFQNGTLIYRSDEGGAPQVWSVYGLIHRAWGEDDFERGVMGFPTSDEHQDGQRRRSNFEGGWITWSPNEGARRNVLRDERDPFEAAAEGFADTPLALGAVQGGVEPIKAGGALRRFARGVIVQLPAGDFFPVLGLIADKWLALGGALSPVGFPSAAPRRSGTNRGWVGVFERGWILLRDGDEEAFVVYGAIFSKWVEKLHEAGVMGFPITDELPGVRGGRISEFEGGAVLWDPARGARAVLSPVLEAWAHRGREAGVYGLPLSDTVSWDFSKGELAQSFEGGSLRARELRRTALHTSAPNVGADASTSLVLGERDDSLGSARDVDLGSLRSPIRVRVLPGSRALLLDDRWYVEQTRTLPLTATTRQMQLRALTAIVRESHMHRFSDEGIDKLRAGVERSVEKFDEYTFGLLRVQQSALTLELSVGPDDFEEEEPLSDGRRPIGFRSYEKVRQAIADAGVDVSHYDIVHIMLPFDGGHSEHVRPNLAFANPRRGRELLEMGTAHTRTTVHNVTNRGEYWWAIMVHETFHHIEWGLGDVYPELLNPDTGSFWIPSYPAFDSAPDAPQPINTGNWQEWLLYAMLQRIKGDFLRLAERWGRLVQHAAPDPERGDLIAYASPHAHVIIERALQTWDGLGPAALRALSEAPPDVAAEAARPAEAVIEADGLVFQAHEALATTAFANEADADTLRAAGFSSRQVQALLEARPFADLQALSHTRGVGARTLERLRDAAPRRSKEPAPGVSPAELCSW